MATTCFECVCVFETFVRMENSFGLVQSESMDLQNDPRFFQANVLNKRHP